MKTHILMAVATAALTLRATAIFAADLAAPAPLATPLPLWTGLHLGLNAGYSFDADPSVFTAGSPAQTGFDAFFAATHALASAVAATGGTTAPASGATGGAQLGFDYQIGRFVVGLEADIQGVGGRGRGGFLGGSGATLGGAPTDVTAFGVEQEKSVDWLGTARGRVGYLATPVLLGYVTGGLAYGGVSARALLAQSWSGAVGVSLQSPGATGEFSETRVGWTVGGGVEWAFAPHLSAKAEYLYYDLGSARFASGAATTSLFAGLSDTIVTTTRARFSGHLARLGVNYHLDPFGPAASQPAPRPLWSGVYVGLNAGYAFDGDPNVLTFAYPTLADVDGLLAGAYTGLSHGAASALAATGTASARSEGFLAGAQAGYNLRFDRFVVGVEADIQGAGAKGRGGFLSAAAASIAPAADSIASAVAIGKRVDWLGTLRARPGYLILPELLVYATAGLAYGGVEADSALFGAWSGSALGPLLRSSQSVGRFSGTRVGWTVGGGVEWALAPQLSVKTEYLFYDLGDARFAASPSTTDLLGAFANVAVPFAQARFEGHVGRIGLNFHFDAAESAAPLLARY